MSGPRTFTGASPERGSGRKPPRAIPYLRVSTNEQATEGLGLDVQLQACRSWAQRNGYVLVPGERDEGISGTAPLDERPGLARALARLEDKAAEALIVYRLDRLARDIIVQETVVRRLEAAGRRVISATEPDITSSDEDPTRALVRGLLGLIAAYERAVIKGRLASARRLKAERGEYAGGRPPYGYAAVSGTLIPLPDEQRVLRRIAELRREGCSLQGICRRLADEGLKPRSAQRWHPWQIAKLLRRTSAYDGKPSARPRQSSSASSTVIS